MFISPILLSHQTLPKLASLENNFSGFTFAIDHSNNTIFFNLELRLINTTAANQYKMDAIHSFIKSSTINKNNPNMLKNKIVTDEQIKESILLADIEQDDYDGHHGSGVLGVLDVSIYKARLAAANMCTSVQNNYPNQYADKILIPYIVGPPSLVDFESSPFFPFSIPKLRIHHENQISADDYNISQGLEFYCVYKDTVN